MGDREDRYLPSYSYSFSFSASSDTGSKVRPLQPAPERMREKDYVEKAVGTTDCTECTDQEDDGVRILFTRMVTLFP